MDILDQSQQKRLAALVKKLRGDRSARDFAQLIGVTHPTITGWEFGFVNPELGSLLKLAERIERSLDELNLYLTGCVSLEDLLSGEALQRSLTLEQLLQEVRSLSPVDALQVAEVALSVLSKAIKDEH